MEAQQRFNSDDEMDIDTELDQLPPPVFMESSYTKIIDDALSELMDEEKEGIDGYTHRLFDKSKIQKLEQTLAARDARVKQLEAEIAKLEKQVELQKRAFFLFPEQNRQ